MIGAVDDMTKLDESLSYVDQHLDRVNGLLPVGVGLILFAVKLAQAAKVLEKHKPAVVWLFAAPELDNYGKWAASIRQASPQSQIWIQVGSVAAAVELAEKARPDVLCCQGSDAGGHGFEKGAGIISLGPEVCDTLAAKGYDIPIVAAGGIADGRCVSAALSLGAQGVVLGTRFLSAPETEMHPVYRRAIISTTDGGQTTARSKVFDNLRGPNIWPLAYDGRSLIMESFTDHANGVGIEEIRERHNAAVKSDNRGFGEGGKGRAAIWAGTGVGLVKREQPAAEIVEEVRSQARKVLEGLTSRM